MSTQPKQLSISEIQNGTVIDHIDAGKALQIINLLRLRSTDKRKVMIGLNLPGKHCSKDIIKLEDRELSEEEANQLAILSPQITINIIKNYAVQNKFVLSIPDTIQEVIVCPNIRCITNHEKITTFFFVHRRPHSIQLRCKYCEKVFVRDEIKAYNT